MTKAGFSAVLLAVGLAASADQTARPSKASTAAGVTPGGLLYSVSPRTRELRLYGIDGAARAAF